MKIAILGGTRFIGRHIAQMAQKRGHEVTVLHRGKHVASLNGVNEYLVDRDDQQALFNALRALSADTLIDTFAMSGVQAKRTIGALGAIQRIVVLSSQDVYAQFGRLNGHPFENVEPLVTEQSPKTVQFPFKGIGDHEGGIEYDKNDVEDAFKNASTNQFESTTILRLPAVFGSDDYKRRFGSFVDFLDCGERILPCQEGASWRWTHAHVANVAHGVVLAAEKGLPGYHVFNVGEQVVPTMRERAEKIARLMRISIDWEETKDLPTALSIFGKMPNDFVADTSRIRVLLGYEEVLTEDESYLDLVDWSRKTRSLPRD